jgi:hypothetical protein
MLGTRNNDVHAIIVEFDGIVLEGHGTLSERSTLACIGDVLRIVFVEVDEFG